MPETDKIAPKDLLNKIIQVGVVVKDIEEPIAGMRRIFGIEPDFVREAKYPQITYRDSVKDDAWAKIASYSHFGVKIEFMQPMGEGDSMWSEFVDENTSRYALHHIRFNDVENNDVLTQALQERGVSVYQEGRSVVNPDGKFTFYDTVEQIGFVSEACTAPKDAN